MKNTIIQEKPESGKLHNLLEQVYEILNKKDSGNLYDTGTYEALEKIIRLRSKHDAFQKIFDDVNDVAASMMELDFSKRLSLPSHITDKNNIFNYISLALNALNEELELRSISKN